MNWKTIDNPLFQFGRDDPFTKLHLDFASKSPPDELFHYTSAESFLAIIESQCMLATERSFLNDPEEFEWGMQLAERRVDAGCRQEYFAEFIEQTRTALREKRFDDLRLFVLSFSANPDLLSQWRAYASNGEGFSVGFDGTVLRDRGGFGEHTLRGIDLDEMPREYVYCFHLLPVIYDEQEQTDTLVTFMNAAHRFWTTCTDSADPIYQQLFRLQFQHRIKEILISFKHPAFREEAEWRLVATVHKNSEQINYRCGRYGITPYVRLNLSRREDLPGLRLPMTTIFAGPNSPAKRNARGLKMLCESKGVDARLKQSGIKYRP
jgi:hypothetical protein